jgi:hypothetical protein
LSLLLVYYFYAAFDLSPVEFDLNPTIVSPAGAKSLIFFLDHLFGFAATAYR